MAITIETIKGVCREADAQAVYRELRNTNGFLTFARCYMHSKDSSVTRNALWILTKANKTELSQLQVILHEWINLAMQTDSPSVRRLSLNIVERLNMNEEDLRTDFLDFCLEHMISVEEYSGIQTLCMKLALRMCRFYPELMGEFNRTIDAMRIEFYKPAVKSLRKNIMADRR